MTKRMMRRMMRRVIVAALAALALPGCGVASSAGNFISDHLSCPADIYASPTWTPSSGRIIYTLATGTHIDIHSMTVQGGDDRLLLSGGIQPVISPDGTRLLYTSAASGSAPTSSAMPPHQGLLDLTDGKVTNLGDLGILPAWSPDGQSIAYRPLGGSGIMLLNVESGHKTALTNASPGTLVGDVHPEWSPDGKRIAFSSGREGALLLYAMDADGQNLTPLVRQDDPSCPGYGWPVSNAPLAWNPGGKLLAFTRFCGGAETLGLVTADAHELTGRGYLMAGVSTLEWSPDGTRLLMIAQGPGGDTLYTADQDGQHLLAVRAGAYDPSWSPDGKRIAFGASDSAGLEQLYTINPDGTGEQQITANPGGGICPH